MRNNLLEKFDEYYGNKEYSVKDIIRKKESKIIFILESPHNDELRCGHPVAGQSGIDMADFILKGENNGKSLGDVAKGNIGLGISIINVSKVPLQITENLEKEYSYLLSKLEIVRKNYESFGNHTQNKELNIIEGKIFEDFNRRFYELKLTNETLIVVCGKFAEIYFNKISCESNNIIYVPHPSRGQWKINYDGLLFKNIC